VGPRHGDGLPHVVFFPLIFLPPSAAPDSAASPPAFTVGLRLRPVTGTATTAAEGGHRTQNWASRRGTGVVQAGE